MGEPTGPTPQSSGAGTEGSLPTWKRSWRDWYLVAVLIGFVGYCLGPSLIGLRTLLSVDELTQFFPWMALHGSAAAGHETCSGDTIDGIMPGIAHVRGQLFSGHLASWQNLVSGGGPLSSVPNLGLLDPLSLPYFVLPLWLAPAFVVLLSFVVAVGGTFLFLRRLTLSRPGAMLAGLIFATSGFMVMWTNWPQTRVAALIPPLFWAVERLVQRERLTDAVLVAAVVASMIFGGFPAVTGYALYLASAYLLVRLIMIHRARLRGGLRVLGLAAVGLVLGVAVTGVQLLPFVSFYGQANLAYRAGSARLGLPFGGLITLIAPNANGLCIGGHATHGTENAVELVAYVGAAAVVLAVAGAAFGLRRRLSAARGIRGFFVAAAVVIVVLGWTSPTARQVVAHLPAFAGNFIGRIRSVLGFVLAVLAAIGFDWVTIRSPDPGKALGQTKRRRVWAPLVWVTAFAVGILVLLRSRHEALAGNYWADEIRALWIPAVLVAVALVTVGLSRHRHRWAQTAAFIVLPLLVVGQGAQFFHAVLPGDATRNFYPITPAQRFLASHLGHDRFASSALTMYPATGLYYGLRTPTGHAFTEKAWQDLLSRVDPATMQTPTFSDFSAALNQTTVGVQPILDRMGVKYFVSQPSELAGRPQPLPPLNGALDVRSGPAQCTLPGQPLRGITFEVTHVLDAADPVTGETLYVTVRQGDQTVSSGRYMGPTVVAGSLVSIAVAGENLATGGTMTVTIRAAGARGDLTLATHGGSIACAAVIPIADHLKLVHADPGSIIYQRLDALPRIRWASRSIVIPGAAARVAALEKGLPGDEVVLNSTGPQGSGRNAAVSVSNDSGDEVAAEVNASGAGYLVVADAMQQSGWSVTVDGKAARLVPADDAMVAVYVPAGRHRIVFDYAAPGQVEGAALSVTATLIGVALVLWDRRRRAMPSRNGLATPAAG